MDLPLIQPPLNIVLFEPDIPPNTGNIARLCAGTGAILHLIEPLGFRLTDQAMKRAGLDYWDAVTLLRHKNFDAFMEQHAAGRLFLLSTRGKTPYTAARYQPGDALLFGSETRGLPEALHERFADTTLTIPMLPGAIRSINLANSAAIVLYEALRQFGPQ
ncbi:MAG: tRNA (cytidine(34)-2'-O)-methyltransferase [Kiritimatiellae bacterium]|nr:tRNA (cytidine(34)-2'-O)-methyltransferase [Kiritimatiellia bacterium]